MAFLIANIIIFGPMKFRIVLEINVISTYFVQSNGLFYFIYDESLISQNYLQIIETILENVLETLSLQQYSKYRIFDDGFDV